MVGDRRIGSRFSADEEVEVFVPDASGNETRTGTLRDLSRSGARIRLEHAIPLNTAIRIKIRDQQLNASVRSCARMPGGFGVGIEFESEFEGPLRPAG
jgi:hypothetical protein